MTCRSTSRAARLLGLALPPVVLGALRDEPAAEDAQGRDRRVDPVQRVGAARRAPPSGPRRGGGGARPGGGGPRPGEPLPLAHRYGRTQLAEASAALAG